MLYIIQAGEHSNNNGLIGYQVNVNTHLVGEEVFEGDDVLVLPQVAHDPHLPQDVLGIHAVCRCCCCCCC